MAGQCPGQTSPVQFIGDRTTPSNVLIAAFNDQCFYCTQGAWVSFAGFAVEATGVPATGTGNAIVSTLNSVVFLDRIHFGACSTSHIFASRAAYAGILAGADCSIAGGALPLQSLISVPGRTQQLLDHADKRHFQFCFAV
jgi:hypothetical protein